MKQSILSSFVDQRDEMQNREMRLLSQVDVVLYEKDDALLTQLGKLNQVLGCLRNCLSSPHPCGECLEKSVKRLLDYSHFICSMKGGDRLRCLYSSLRTGCSPSSVWRLA